MQSGHPYNQDTSLIQEFRTPHQSGQFPEKSGHLTNTDNPLCVHISPTNTKINLSNPLIYTPHTTLYQLRLERGLLLLPAAKTTPEIFILVCSLPIAQWANYTRL